MLRVPQLEDYVTVVDYVLSAEDPADGGDRRPLGPNAWLFAAPVGVEPRPDAVARLAASLPDATTFAGYVVNASSEAAYLAQPPHAAVDRGAFVRSRADAGARAETRRGHLGYPKNSSEMLVPPSHRTRFPRFRKGPAGSKAPRT